MRNLPGWYPKAFRFLLLFVLLLIGLGGSVRVMNAGLACPDWPLCFGDVIPDYHPQVYFEFIHRVVAGLVSIGVVVLAIVLFRAKNVAKSTKYIFAGALLLLVTQIVFGGLTVLLQLHSKVVAAHLGMGTGFFAILAWLNETFKNQNSARGPSWLANWSIFVLIAVYAQIILGGLVASHYAANVCPGEFPTCHGQWFPTFEGIIGLHIIHRLWAYSVVAIVIGNYILVRKHGDAKMRKLAGMLMGVVFVQVGVGIANVLFYTPPLIAVIHLLFAAKILWVATRQVHHSHLWLKARSPAASQGVPFGRPAR